MRRREPGPDLFPHQGNPDRTGGIGAGRKNGIQIRVGANGHIPVKIFRSEGKEDAEAGKRDLGSGGAKNRAEPFDWRREEGRPHGGIRSQVQDRNDSIPSCLPEDRPRPGIGYDWSSRKLLSGFEAVSEEPINGYGKRKRSGIKYTVRGTPEMIVFK